MTHHYKYTANFIPAQEGGYVVSVPALPGCHTEGDTIEEAEKNAQEAIELYLETLQARGEKIPEDLSPIQKEISLTIQDHA